ncbi:class B sortase [Peptoniphilus sp. MSJ-1]|uniref:Class B sortase n=1 Tax=Peptoniphilus ovalis TaxID=2841503 RepID=A0ABS6FGW1_9FIRM|nr:class B sortase [Peptoniphilus ovalis]MBU5668698.1 class B sortase [Peptoniphilus ovalis]
MKNKIIIAVEICLVLIIAFSGFKIYSYHKDNKEFQATHAELKENLNSLDTSEVKIEDNSANKKLIALNKEYNDIIGWIKIDGTDIDFPIVQAKDNDFYLDHNYKGEYHPFGEVFMDARNSYDFSDQNTILYGHNVRSGHIFHDLEKFKEQSFRDNYPDIVLETLDGKKIYEIVAVYPANVNDDYRNPNYDSEEWQVFRKFVEERNLLNNKLPEENEKILTLSTCSDDKDRLAIHAKLVN